MAPCPPTKALPHRQEAAPDVIEKLLLRAGPLSSSPRRGAGHEHTAVRAGARGAARAQLGLRRRVAECIPLRLRAGTCGGRGGGGWSGVQPLTGRLAARLSRPAHAPAAIWRHAVGSRHGAAAAAEPRRLGGRGGEPHLCTPPFDRRRAPCSSQRHSSHSAHCGGAPTAAPQKATPSAARCAAAAPCAHAALHASTYAHAHAHACAKVAQGGGGGRGGGRQARVRASRAGLSQGQETSP